MTNLLKVENLRVSFDTFRGEAFVIDGVDIEVNENETVGLAGETGCGKSVTMKAIIQILPVPPAKITSGRIWFNGHDLLSMDKRSIDNLRGKEMSMIPQDPMTSLNPVFTIGQQITQVIKWAGIKEEDPVLKLIKGINPIRNNRRKKDLKEQAIRILEKVGLADPQRIMRSYPFELSGGMCQRVLIGMALVTSPKFLIADEPGTALDVTIQSQILSLFSDIISESRLSVLLITHNLGVLRERANRCYIMYAGTVVEAGDTVEIFENPLHPYTKGLLKAVPKIVGEKGIGTGIPGIIPDYTNPPVGCRFRPRCPIASDGCKQKPKLMDVSKNHKVACWHMQGEVK